MPEKEARQRAQRDKQEGKSPSTQASEFVREEMKQIGKGKRGPQSPQQAIAIGLSEARRAGIDIKPPASGKASPATRKKAKKDYEKGQALKAGSKATAKRSKSTTEKSATK